MKTVNVVKRFRLHHPSGVFTEFPVGQHDVEDDIADHPYVKVHTAPVKDKLFKLPSPVIPVDEPEEPKKPRVLATPHDQPVDLVVPVTEPKASKK